MLNNLTDVVKNLLIINVLFYLVTMQDHQSLLGFDLVAYYPTSRLFHAYQVVTHMFMHASPMHIFFNMYGLVLLGPPLEQRMGKEKFLFYYLFAGLGSIALYYFVKYVELNYLGYNVSINTPMLGASGAIFGILAGFGTLFPNIRLQLIFPPIAFKAKWFVLIYAGIELYLGLSGRQPGVAHFAHLGGALFGFLLLMYWRKKRLI